MGRAGGPCGRRTMSDWQETGNASESIVLSFEGVNLDEKDALDMENFSRGLKAPADEDPGGKIYAANARIRSRAISPRDAFRLGLAAILGLGGYYGLVMLGVSGGVLLVGGGIGVFIGYALPTLFELVRAQQAKPIERTVDDSFRITVSPAGLTVEGQTIGRKEIELEAIDHFTGMGRLTIHGRTGAPIALACGLKNRSLQPLAARLDELVREAKAHRGYRGS